MESSGQASMVPLSPLFLPTALSILAMSPAFLGFVIGSPHSMDNLSRNEWSLASLQLPLLCGCLYTCFPFLSSMKSIAAGVWPGWSWFFLGMPDNIQEEFRFKKRQ